MSLHMGQWGGKMRASRTPAKSRSSSCRSRRRFLPNLQLQPSRLSESQLSTRNRAACGNLSFKKNKLQSQRNHKNQRQPISLKIKLWKTLKTRESLVLRNSNRASSSHQIQSRRYFLAANGSKWSLARATPVLDLSKSSNRKRRCRPKQIINTARISLQSLINLNRPFQTTNYNLIIKKKKKAT